MSVLVSFLLTRSIFSEQKSSCLCKAANACNEKQDSLIAINLTLKLATRTLLSVVSVSSLSELSVSDVVIASAMSEGKSSSITVELVSTLIESSMVLKG